MSQRNNGLWRRMCRDRARAVRLESILDTSIEGTRRGGGPFFGWSRERLREVGAVRALFFAALLALGCKGSGCTPGDFMETCKSSCGEAGVRLALATTDVCICNDKREAK